jgi:hypothetical protein
MAMPEQAGDPGGLEIGEPVVERVRVPGTQQAGACHRVRRLTRSDLQHGGAALAQVRMGVVVAVVEKLVALVVGQGHRAALGHRVIPPLGFRYSIIPILVVKTHEAIDLIDPVNAIITDRRQLSFRLSDD